MAELKYKVGDKVRIKDIGWYNNKDKWGVIETSSYRFVSIMSQFCGKVVTIKDVIAHIDFTDDFENADEYVDYYYYHMEEIGYNWTDEMIECKVEEETKPEPKFKIGEVVYVIDYDTDLKIQNRIYKNGMWNYIINIESAPFIFYDNELKKKKEYPKTYEECCDILDCYSYNIGFDKCKSSSEEVLHDVLLAFRKLLICRNAYWRIAGEEMGLGKPWEPDWKNSEEKRYSIVNIEGDINLPEKILTKWILKVTNKILVFPTEEMRDAFYDNFKEEIEICKELL